MAAWNFVRTGKWTGMVQLYLFTFLLDSTIAPTITNAAAQEHRRPVQGTDGGRGPDNVATVGKKIPIQPSITIKAPIARGVYPTELLPPSLLTIIPIEPPN